MINQDKNISKSQDVKSAGEVSIVPFETKYANAFKMLNEEWISQYFKLEEEDRRLLQEPQKSILDSGGKIYVALYKEEPIGVCALKRLSDDECEMAKMAVSPKAQGMGAGWLLAKAVIDGARELGAKKISLESNTKLVPAIKLYEKLGFTEVKAYSSPSYTRVDIFMELDL